MPSRWIAATVASAMVLTAGHARADDPPSEPLPPAPIEPAPLVPAPLATAPAAPLPPPQFVPYAESGFVTVRVVADAPGVFLEALSQGEPRADSSDGAPQEATEGKAARWQRVCSAPCTMRVPSVLRYRVAGPLVPASDEFSLGPPGGERSLHIEAGSKKAQFGGALLFFVGVPASIIGVVLAVTADDPDDHDARTAGFIALGVGAALTLAGAAVVAANGTSVFDREGRKVGLRGLPIGKSAWLTPRGLVF